MALNYPSTDTFGPDATTSAFHLMDHVTDYSTYIYLFLIVILVGTLISVMAGGFFIYKCVKAQNTIDKIKGIN